jgi:predicted nucleotidyltransferase
MLDQKTILTYLTEIKPELSRDGIEKIGLFGSFARYEADLLSDVDIVIKTTDSFIEQHQGAAGFIYLDALRQKIEQHLRRRVDLCDESGLKNKKVLEDVIYV